MATAWVDEFLTFFEENKMAIGTVMYAEGCREGWLQGEMYRKSNDPAFTVNSYKLTKLNGKVDIYGEKPSHSHTKQKMVAEIKIVAPSFLSKNIDGNNEIEQYAENKVVKITNTHLNNVNFEEGSILKDLARLKSISDENIEKYMILVIPRYEECKINKPLEKALYSISLSDNVWEKKYEKEHFDIRVWLIK